MWKAILLAAFLWLISTIKVLVQKLFFRLRMMRISMQDNEPTQIKLIASRESLGGFSNIGLNKQKEANIKLEGSKHKSKSQEDKSQVKFSIQSSNEQKQQKFNYQNLELQQQEQLCSYQLQGWPMIKDICGIDRYRALKFLSKGDLGEVYECKDIEQNETVYLSILNISLSCEGTYDDNIAKNLLKEFNFYKTVKHENVVQIKQLLELGRGKIALVSECCSGPKLSDYLKNNIFFEQKDAKKIIYQILAGLNYLLVLFKQGMPDELTPQDIIFHNGTVKILRFGLYPILDEERIMILKFETSQNLWPQLSAILSRLRTKISYKISVQSIGAIFFQLLYGKRPFANEVSHKSMMQRNLIVVQGQKLVFPGKNPNGYKISKIAMQYMKQLMECDPDNRLTIQQAFNHPYFKEYHPIAPSE